MSCATVIEATDGTTTIQITSAGTATGFTITREPITGGLMPWRAADGSGALDVRYLKYRYTISGSGYGDPGIYSLDLSAASWEITLGGWEDGSAEVELTVVPAYPPHSKNRRDGTHSWTWVLEDA